MIHHPLSSFPHSSLSCEPHTETDGQTHSAVRRTSSGGDGEKGGEEGGGEGRDVVGRELEDTLKASEEKQVRRNVSLPPGIEDSGRSVTPTDVRLRSKIPASHSMDTITKVSTYMQFVVHIHTTMEQILMFFYVKLLAQCSIL